MAFGKQPLPTNPVIPEGLGYNIHFTNARPGEMEMIAESGATIIRMDFGWNGTEREKGVYNFSAFERLTDSLEQHKMVPLYILDYSNRLYDDGLSPYSDEGRHAFAKWAAAAAVHFKGRGILWEMYNEPNLSQFWKPRVNADDYIKLALEVGKALREAAPDEFYVGPATSEIDFDFLEKCFQGGLLEYWDAVTVHPYRQTAPETVIEEYAKLRYMIDKYAPKGKHIPIHSGEWGYSSVWGGYNDERQGKMLPRQWMINLACDIPVSIWYDWHDDGTDPREPEHHFGTVNYAYFRDRSPVYDPKPAYIAAKTFTETFRGLRYNKRIMCETSTLFSVKSRGDVFIILFSNDDHSAVKFAIWTTAREAQTITTTWIPGKYKAISYLGEELPDVVVERKRGLSLWSGFNGSELTLTVSDGPIYLIPENSEGWNEAAKIESFPLAVYRDQMSERLYGRRLQGHTVNGISQRTEVIGANPLKFGVPFLHGDNLVLFVDNPGGEALSSQSVRITNVEGLELTETTRTFQFDPGQTATSLLFPVKTKPTGTYKLGVNLSRDFVIFPPRTMRPLDDFSRYNTQTLNAAWEVLPDGDRNVGSEQKIEMTEDGHVKITYRFDDGWKFLRLAPKNAALQMVDERAPINASESATAYQITTEVMEKSWGGEWSAPTSGTRTVIDSEGNETQRQWVMLWAFNDNAMQATVTPDVVQTLVEETDFQGISTAAFDPEKTAPNTDDGKSQWREVIEKKPGEYQVTPVVMIGGIDGTSNVGTGIGTGGNDIVNVAWQAPPTAIDWAKLEAHHGAYPKELGVLIEGDGSGNRVRLRFTDARGRTYQPDGGAMTEKKPYYFSFPLNDASVSHWGGTESNVPDDMIAYPIRFDSLVIDGTRSGTGPHSITLLSPMVVIYHR